MSVFVLTYDLKAPHKDYNNLYEALKKYTYCHGVESVWLIDSQKSASEIRDDLNKHIDNNDVLFVAKLSGNWASMRYSCAEWLKSSSRTW